MIPAHPWYEMLRFMLRCDDRFAWELREEPRCWFYGVAEWSMPHQRYRVIHVHYAITVEALENIEPRIVPNLLQHAISRYEDYVR